MPQVQDQSLDLLTCSPVLDCAKAVFWHQKESPNSKDTCFRKTFFKSISCHYERVKWVVKPINPSKWVGNGWGMGVVGYYATEITLAVSPDLLKTQLKCQQNPIKRSAFSTWQMECPDSYGITSHSLPIKYFKQDRDCKLCSPSFLYN